MNRKINNPPTRSARTAYYLSERVTLAGADYYGETSGRAFDAGISGVLARTAAMAGDRGEATIVVDPAAAYRLGLRDDSPASAIANANAAGWKTSRRIGTWTVFYADDRPSIYVGQHEGIFTEVETDPTVWPFSSDPRDMVPQLQHWHDLTGVTWQAGPAVMGIELMHRHLPKWRMPGETRLKGATKTDRHTPDGAGEAVWSPTLWRRPMADVSRETSAPDTLYLHKYDKVRAGITAAGVAKLSPPALVRTGPIREWDGKRAGWFSISVPPWNEPRLPHPCGPGAVLWERRWVTAATLDLLSALAGQGRIDMPEIIDSWSGPARPLLLPLVKVIEEAWDAPLVDGRYYEQDREQLRQALKEVATRGFGMLAHVNAETGEPASTIYRPDWFASIAATKRCNGWRILDEIATGEGRYPVWVDDDAVVYASAEPDPYKAAPAAFSGTAPGGRLRQLDGGNPGDYRYQETIESRKKVAA